MPEQIEQLLIFEPLGKRSVEADFSGGHLSSDGGLLLLRQVDHFLGLSDKLASCFDDSRQQVFVEHSIPHMVAQRLFGIAQGYEDINDHTALRLDPLLATTVGKEDPTGMDRICEKDKGKPMASASTLNRLELGNQKGAAQYRKIAPCPEKIEQLLLEMGVQTLSPETTEVVLDFDATDDIIHGSQEDSFFHGYYKNYCYLPLYCFIGSVPVWAQLRPSNIDASKGTVEALQKIVPMIQQRCPNAKIIVRADSGFCREEIMAWCEANGVLYCFGLARNDRLEKQLVKAFFWARAQFCLYGFGRQFEEFSYQTLKTWSCERRVIGKAEVLPKGDNPRFIVTNLPFAGFTAETPERFSPRACYEKFYCARGDMENRIKEQQLDLFADRTSTSYMGSNQLRLWFSTFAYLMLERLRTLGLKGTQLAKATAGTIRVRLLKAAVHVNVSIRRIYIRLASAFPLKDVFTTAYRQLKELSPQHS
jgi:hypothetical protein